ncbi:regulator of chromosome condensation 1/beta-lactamase-inhibitor protein II [Xylariaceae sp. FL1272]|nr:regulator of chromosome condensation 1/beta-lactamase-inhibitor protein II [Xylariaceae sp. FL1272]
MELIATGFNAWNQLTFLAPGEDSGEPDDLSSFQRVLSDKLIEILYISLSCTVVKTSAGINPAGYEDASLKLPELREKLFSSTAAIAGNESIAIYDGDQTITQYASISALTISEAQHTFTDLKGIIQLVSYETGFAALSQDGRVYTWGDERYASCLGRELASSSSTSPGVVEDLLDLPSSKITKIAASGYVLCALTSENDLYAWGGHPGRAPILDSLSDSPSPVVIEEHDIADVAVGETHIIALATTGEVYVVGSNNNGQLGLPDVDKTTTWTKVPVSLKPGETITGVRAGPRSSFIITSDDHSV